MSITGVFCVSSNAQHKPNIDLAGPPAYTLVRAALKTPLERDCLLGIHKTFGRLDIPAPHCLVVLRAQRDLKHRHPAPLLSHIDDVPAHDQAVSIFVSLHPVEDQTLSGNHGRPPDERIGRLRGRPRSDNRPLQKNEQTQQHGKNRPRRAVPGEHGLHGDGRAGRLRGLERSLGLVRLDRIGNIVGNDLGTAGILVEDRFKNLLGLGLGLGRGLRRLPLIHRPHQRGKIIAAAAGPFVCLPGKNIVRAAVIGEIVRFVFVRMPNMAAVGALNLPPLGTEGTAAQIERGRALRTRDNHGNANLLFIRTIL